MTVSTVEVLLPWRAEQVWQVVTDLRRTGWRSDLSRVEERGPAEFVEYTREGVATRFFVTQVHPCRRWEFHLENPSLRGNWTGEFFQEAQGTRLRCTERVQAKRWWMAPFVKGYLKRQQARYMEDLSRELERRHGESPLETRKKAERCLPLCFFAD